MKPIQDQLRDRIRAACEKVSADGYHVIAGEWGIYFPGPGTLAVLDNENRCLCPMGAVAVAEGVQCQNYAVANVETDIVLARHLGVSPEWVMGFTKGVDYEDTSAEPTKEQEDGFALGQQFRRYIDTGAMP